MPEGLLSIGDHAFLLGKKAQVRELYIPTTVETIGEDAFLDMGPERSPRGNFQGRITCLPKWINTSNCTKYGIDDKAVKVYEDELYK